MGVQIDRTSPTPEKTTLKKSNFNSVSKLNEVNSSQHMTLFNN